MLTSKTEIGFTLIDLLMVVAIVSVLVAALFVGRQIMINGDTRDLAAQFDGVRSAINTYVDRFGVLPGDDSGAALRWPEIKSAGNCDGIIEGNWGAALRNWDVPETEAEESRLFWLHLRMANLYPGSTDGIAGLRQPKNTVGGIIGVQEHNYGMRGTVICMSGVSPAAAHVLDSQLDDGVASSGRVRGNVAEQAFVGREEYSGADNYNLCRRL